ncbi:terminase large subunit [Amycolatopsis sp. CA-128772]|uniref:terminase large subunit n=1 Tax=Amycolatopsis sp. CA-128772 TaxID=2073159 RepID=UPI000CD21790|nr:terminase TerL endonuclease subunit [Amycolatopsis sp. CA-128772]
MARKKTRSPARASRARQAAPADGVELSAADDKRRRRLLLSREVAYYLTSRGIPWPDCPPKLKTPEPDEQPGARFDPARVDRVLAVFGRLRHTQGKWAGNPLKPDAWQVAYVLAPVFGWVHQNDAGDWVRVIRRVYVDIPRKNGKTTTAGGIATYLTCADREAGAQVYAVASGRDQARYCFDPVKQIAERSPALSPYVKTLASRIVHKPSGSYFAVVSKVADLLHGANVHGAIIDELHVHKTAELVEAVETGTGSRTQPLTVIITTADDGRRTTIYARRREYVEQVARRALADPGLYGVVWACDEDDDPFAESTWRKANPGFGVSPTRESLAQAALQAKASPADLANFLRLHLGRRTKQETRYYEMADWDANASLVDTSKLRGRRAFGGLDLASTSDLLALCWLFPDDDGGYDAVWRLWTPEENIPKLDKRTAGSASAWVRQGLITATPGNVADYGYVRDAIARDLDAYDVQEIAYDPWNATQLVNDLVSDGAPMVQMRQGYASLSAPTKELQRLLLEGTPERPVFRHGGNAAVRWQVDNVAVAMDPAGNVKPDKGKSGDKIDAVAAAINALARAMASTGPARSKYEDDDLMILGG